MTALSRISGIQLGEITDMLLSVVRFGLWMFAAALPGTGGENLPTDCGETAAFVRNAIARGEKHIRVPAKRAYLETEGDCYFDLRGVSDVEIDFGGCDFFGRRRVQALSLANCTNVTVRNLTFDYDPLGFTQAKIVSVGPDREWDLEVIDGYPAPSAECAYWPMQVYDAANYELINQMRCWDGFALTKTGDNRYRVTGGRDRTGSVGDIVVWPLRDLPKSRACTVLLTDCADCMLENVRIYSTIPGYAVYEVSCSGNTYRRLVIDRRPPETDCRKRGVKRLRSGNHDGFHSKFAERGPVLDGCRIAYHCDDAVNISSYYYIVSEVDGNRVRIVGHDTMALDPPVSFPFEIEKGNELEVLTVDGEVLKGPRVCSVGAEGPVSDEEQKYLESLSLWQGVVKQLHRAVWISVDDATGLKRGDGVISTARQARGFVIRNCHFGPNRAHGIRLRASDGLVESNLVERVLGSGLWMGPEYCWVEGGACRNVTVRGNFFAQCGDKGVAVTGYAAKGRHLAKDAHGKMRIVDNRVTDSKRGYELEGCEQGVVHGNTEVRSDGGLHGVMLTDGEITEDDFRTLNAWGVRLVRYQMNCGFFRHGEMEGGAAAYDRWLDGQLDRLERDVLPWARRFGMKVVVDLHVPPGGRAAGKSMDWALYADRSLQDRLIGCWRKIAKRLKGNAATVYGYDILNEPVQARWSEDLTWWTVQLEVAKAIRQIDAETPVIVESPDWDSPEGFAAMRPLEGVGPVIYQVHLYRPNEYTHQGVSEDKSAKLRWPDAVRGWNRDFIRERLKPVRDFERRTGAKIYVGEFSAIVWAEGADRYLADCVAVLREYGWDWTYHAFREWKGWSLEHEADGWGKSSSFRLSPDNPRLRVLLDAFGGTNVVAAANRPLSWDEALVVGRTNGDKCFYKVGEDIIFTLELKGVEGNLPAGEYFYDWERTANDGKVEKGRAPVERPLVVRTRLDRPGFVKLEANVVDRNGRRVPKNHRWEKRVFFQGGVGVEMEKLESWPEPKDYDAYWAARRKEIDDLPLDVMERVKIPCLNDELNLWRVKIRAPEGVRPAIGYLAMPKVASAANRQPATGNLSGYYDMPETCPGFLTNQVKGIQMYINRHGCEVDQPADYYRQFFKPMPKPPVHFRDMAYRGMLMFRFLKSLPEWNGRDLTAYGSSGGGMQSFWMGMLEPQLSCIRCTSAALADVFGFRYGRPTGNIGERVEAINYFDICNAAKRVTCPTYMIAALGDATSPAPGLAIVYNNLKGPKQIIWRQGCTHGWWPKGMATETWSSDP